jgi:putative DNA primase/helicase
MLDAIEQFRDAMRVAGVSPPDMIQDDGSLHRFSSNGRRGDDAGWYVYHANGIPAGAFGDWRADVSQTWRADIGRSLTGEEEARYRAKVEAMRREREAEQERRHAEARQRGASIWEEAQPASGDHPYLVRKGARAHGARLYRGPLVIRDMPCDGSLIIPARNADGVIQSLEFIHPEHRDGDNKRYLFGGDWRGCYFSIGKPNGVLCVAEGYATAASIYEATGHAVAVAFNAGNLEAVARVLRNKLPETKLVVAADDDYKTPGNPGVTKAREAALAVGGLLVVPDFGATRPDDATDFNDLGRYKTPDAIRRAVSDAKSPNIPALQESKTNAMAGDLEAWPEPKPLPEVLPPVKTFEFTLLPDTLRPWAQDICDRVQCAPDFVGVAIMAALGSLIGRKVGIRPQAYTDWTEFPNQWALIVGRPGVLKSPAMEQALSPLKRLAAQAGEAHKLAIAEFSLASKVAKLKAEEGEKAARKKLSESPSADVSALLKCDDLQEPVMRRYIAVNSTAEALGELHRLNPNGLLVHRDEIVGLLKFLDREENSEAREFYLTGWNGNSGYTFDRIKRGFNLHIPAVCLSLLGSTQPGRIAEYIRAAVRGGAGDDGLIQRFGLLVWPDTSGDWRDVDRWPDNTARKTANEVFKNLDSLDPVKVNAHQDQDSDGNFDGAPYLRFEDEALRLFRDWRSNLESSLRNGELHPAMESHLSKYRKSVPALALTLHLASNGTGPVGRRATLQALAWAEYLESHAQRAYASVSNPEVQAAKAICFRLRRGDLQRSFSTWHVWRPGWAMLTDRNLVEDALRLLVDLDWLVSTKSESGGRPATVYVANPRGFQQ